MFFAEKDGDDDVDHGSTMKKTDDSTMKSSSGTLYIQKQANVLYDLIWKNSMHSAFIYESFSSV